MMPDLDIHGYKHRIRLNQCWIHWLVIPCLLFLIALLVTYCCPCPFRLDLCGHVWSYSKSKSLPYNYAEVQGEYSPNTKTSYRLRMGVHVSGGLASEMDQSQKRCFISPLSACYMLQYCAFNVTKSVAKVWVFICFYHQQVLVKWLKESF